MPNPKDPVKLAAYREKMRAIALAKGYGKWMTGKKASATSLAKRSSIQAALGNLPEERAKRSARAKAGGYGKWMAGRKRPPETSEKAAAHTRGKTYLQWYGPERADEEAVKRQTGNRVRWAGIERKPQRPRQGIGWQYSEWRTAVFKRDGYICRHCGAQGQLHAHHVLTWALHPDQRYVVENGLTLCQRCHRAVHFPLAASWQKAKV